MFSEMKGSVMDVVVVTSFYYKDYELVNKTL